MVVLLAVAFVAGVVTGLSPCVLPVLPALAAGGAAGTRRWRPLAVVAGMVLTFSAATLAGSTVLSSMGLPQGFLRDLGIAVLFVLGLALVFPRLGYLLERPFARLGPHRERRPSNGVLLGASLGLVFVPCAGPVLAAVTLVATEHKVSLEVVAVTVLYALGAALPLLLVGYLGLGAATRSGWLRRRAPRLRQGAGALIVATAALVLSGAAQPLQRDIPAYASSVDARIGGSGPVAASLRELDGEKARRAPEAASSDLPDAANPVLTDYGQAPHLTGISTWFNTPGDRPLGTASLRGKVVLVDFWTYSCINCQRELPHLEAWYKAYSRYGLVIIGVHTPEFAFEHSVSNVRRAARALGLTFPVAIDNSYMTWLAFGNSQWPAEYLIDQTGQLRFIHAGEGDYGQIESLIRGLLAAHDEWLPPPTGVADRTPKEVTSPETYLGWPGLQLYTGTRVVVGKALRYRFGAQVPLDYVSFQGTWTNTGTAAVTGPGAELRLDFHARDVYLVLGGRGQVVIYLDGRRARAMAVGGYARLYTVITLPKAVSGLLQLDMTPRLAAYEFTFG